MIGEPVVIVYCDNSLCDYEQQYDMTALARGSFDTRNLESQMESDDWIIEGDITYCCEDCKEEAERK